MNRYEARHAATRTPYRERHPNRPQARTAQTGPPRYRPPSEGELVRAAYAMHVAGITP